LWFDEILMVVWMSMLVIVPVCYKLEELCKLLPDVLQASRDSVTLFGEEPAYASELVLWAHSITEHYFALLKRHVLSSAAVAGGLRSAAECVKVSLAHCLLLEEQGLTLCPTLSKLMRPSVEQALQANLRKIEGSVAALAAADDWVLGHPAVLQHGTRTHSRPGIIVATSNLKLSSSAHHLNVLVQDFLEDVEPLISMHLEGMTLDGLSMLLDQYVDLLMKAIPSLDNDEEELGAENSDRRKVENQVKRTWKACEVVKCLVVHLHAFEMAAWYWLVSVLDPFMSVYK
jgi:hypothetical protein